MDELHAFFRQLRKKEQEAWLEHADTFPRFRIWLANRVRPAGKTLENALDVFRATYEYGGVVAAHTGLSRGRQMLQQLQLYWKHRVPAECYYALGMYEKSVRRTARFFLGDKRASTLLHGLARAAPPEERDPLRNKIAFWHHCREHDLPVVPVLAAFNDGSLQQNGSLQQIDGDIGETLPPRDLFSKPVTAFLGKGAQKWRYEEGRYRDEAGQAYAPSALIDVLKKQSTENALLLQPCVYDHPQLQELTGGRGPSTLRIITIRRPDDAPEYFASFLTTPLKNVPAPTFKRRTALAARVDPNTGRLGRPRHKHRAYLLEGRDQHPRTDNRVTDFKLPDWEKAKSLALQAHEPLPHIMCVGWDFLLTPDGPCLLEGNNDCSATLTQITHQRLLGRTRFPVYFCEHLLRQRQTEDVNV